MRCRLLSILALVACAWLVGNAIPLTVWADGPVHIDTEGISAKMINKGLVDTTKIRQTSPGISAVGRGDMVYLKADSGTIATPTYAWTLTTAPTGSASTLSALDGLRTMFLADSLGDYTVTLKVTGKVSGATRDTSATATRIITAATYVGAAKCGQCHPDVYATWQKTKHATKLQRGLNGIESAGYSAGCVKCHSVGNNTSTFGPDGSASKAIPPDNGSFWSKALKLGWKFPAVLLTGTWTKEPSTGATSPDSSGVGGAYSGWKVELKGSNWDSLSADLKTVANIQCENCHGPGSAHVAGGLAGPPGQRKIARSLEVSVCAYCHDDGSTHHFRPTQWATSLHSQTAKVENGLVANIASCIPCHTGEGWLQLHEYKKTPVLADVQERVSQTCATCHDPHENAVPGSRQLRYAGQMTLTNPMAQSANAVTPVNVQMGNGAVCASCHHLRDGQNKPGNRVHHSHQSEMIFGVGGYHYPGETYASGGHSNVEGVCAGCHMTQPATTDKRFMKLGDHTWKMMNDKAVPGDPDYGLYNTIKCQECHGDLKDFNLNGTQDDIDNMLKILYDLVPKRKDAPAGGWQFPNGVAWAYSATATTSATRQMTQDETNAAYEYLFVQQDGTEGVHNARYARKLLADAIKSLRPKPTAALVGDFNGDGRVDFEDMFLFIAHFGSTSASSNWDAKYDLNNSGTVGYVDWYMFLDNFGKTASSAKPVYVNNGKNRMVGFDLGPTALRSVDNTHFAAQVVVSNATDLRGYGVTLSYNPDELEFVRVLRSQNSLLKAEMAPVTVVSNEPGRLVLADAITSSRTASGSGPLAEVVFVRKGSVPNPIVKVEAAQVSDGAFGLNTMNGGLAAEQAPARFVNELGQNFPNPFNPSTQITYSLAQDSRVHLVVYNILGQVVRDLVDEYRTAGAHAVVWDGKDSVGRQTASGIYIYRIEAGKFSAVRRMVLMK